MIFDLYTTLLIESVPQRTVLCRAMSRAYGMDNPIGNPFGGMAYGEFNSVVVDIVEDAGRWIDREVLQPVYREVIQPVGKTLETIGQGIAKDPLTFIAQAAAVALAPVTLGQSLWALPVIAAASTAAKGGSWEQILTATAISAATAAVGGGFGMENSVGGLIMNGMQTGGSVALGTATYGVMGTQIAATTASAIASAGTGITMAGIGAIGAAAQGKDPFQAALPSLVGTALGFAGNMAGQSSFFAPITETLNDISKNVSPIVSKAMTGVASAMITGAVTGKDMTEVALAGLANTVVSGLVSASNVVAEFFAKDDGSITNLGVAAQSVVADLVGSVAATLASSGKLGTEMGAQFLANTVKTIMPFVTDPKFDAMATNVRATYEASEKKVVALNEAAKNQQALVDRYNDRVGLANNLADEVNSLVAQRDSVAAKYSASNDQGEINRLRDQFNSLEAQIKTKSAEFDAIYAETDEINSLYVEAAKATDIAQKEYFDISKTLGSVGTDLSAKMNEMTKQVTSNLAKDIDPSFNEAEYKELNNLGPNIDAATHFLSVGKDQGLPTNIAASKAQSNELKTNLVGAILKAQGYNSIMQVPPDVYKKTYTMVDTQYGNNLAQLKDATPLNITQWGTYSLGKKLDDYMPKFDAKLAEEAQTERLIDNTITSSWYAKQAAKDYTMPEGMMYATQEDVLRGKAQAVTTKSGYTVWTKADPYVKPIQKYDASTGNISSVSASSNTTTLDDMDPYQRVEFFASADKNILAKEAPHLVETSNAINTVLDWANTRAKEFMKSSPGLMAVAGTIYGAAPEYLKAFNGLSVMNDVAPTSTSLYKFADSIEKMASTMMPEDYQKAWSDMKSSIDSIKKDTSKDWTDVASQFVSNLIEDPLVALNEYGIKELVQEIPDLIAAKGASMLVPGGWSKVAATGTYITLDVLQSIGDSASSSYIETKKTLTDLVGSGKLNMTAEQIELEAMDNAKYSGYIGGGATALMNKLGLSFLPTEMERDVRKGVTGLLSDLYTGTKSTIKEILGENVEELTPQAYLEAKLAKYDPNRDWKKELADVSLQTTVGAGTVAGTISYGTPLKDYSIDAIGAAALKANAQFEQQIQSGNYTMGELGAVLDLWIPPSADYQTLRDDIVPQVLESYPQYASGYEDVSDFISAVSQATGVTNTTALAAAAEKVDNGKFANQVTTAEEAVKILNDSGLVGVTLEDAAKSGIVGSTTEDQAAKAAQYANQQMVTEAELQAAAKQQNYTYTQAELDKLVGRGVEADVIAKFVAEIDPKAVTTEEATQYFKDLGYTKADAAVIAGFVKSAPEAEMQAAVATYVDPRQVTRQEAINFFAGIGYVPTEAEINQYVVQGPEVVQDNIKAQLAEYVDPRFVDANEVKDIFKSMGLDAPVSGTDLARLSGQYAESDLAAKAKEALPIVSANSIYALMSGNSVASEQVKKELLAKIKEYGDLGMSAAEANAAATQAVAAQLGTTQENLLTALGATESNLLLKLENVESTLSDKIELYRNEGLTQAQAQAKALEEMSGQLGTTKEDLLAQIGATETNLGAKLLESEAKTSQAIDLTKTQLTGEINKVADLVGKPAQDVTQADLDYIRSVVAGTAQGETNLGYDVNRDGKIDAADQTAIENQFAIQKNQNIQQQVDPATGQTVYVDTTTGQTVDYWEPAAGTPWAATGIYAELERQKAQAAATAKAQAAKAKTAQQQSQFGQLMGMLFQAPDIAGQQVAVKTPDPAKIGYIYDFSSIFANPSQASMMPSPYGPMNTVAPKQPQQAANQPLFQLASGFAEGGIVNSNDIQVGGSMDDLINILKGST